MPAEFIQLNNSYEFCLWGKDHGKKLVCAPVTTKYTKVTINLAFIRNLVVTSHGHFCDFKFRRTGPRSRSCKSALRPPILFLP